MKLIKHTNGRTYEIIDKCGRYAILRPTELNEGYGQYIVTFGLYEYETGYEWTQGWYFDEFPSTAYVREAMAFYLKKLNEY